MVFVLYSTVQYASNDAPKHLPHDPSLPGICAGSVIDSSCAVSGVRLAGGCCKGCKTFRNISKHNRWIEKRNLATCFVLSFSRELAGPGRQENGISVQEFPGLHTSLASVDSFNVAHVRLNSRSASSVKSANSQQPTANSQQPTANSQQPTANSQQPTANSQQPTTNKA
jgi:hypothetical protein